MTQDPDRQDGVRVQSDCIVLVCEPCEMYFKYQLECPECGEPGKVHSAPAALAALAEGAPK